jgi:hypothetical protein
MKSPPENVRVLEAMSEQKRNICDGASADWQWFRKFSRQNTNRANDEISIAH